MKSIEPRQALGLFVGFAVGLLLVLALGGCATSGWDWDHDPGIAPADSTSEEDVDQVAGTKRINFLWTAPCTTAGVDSCGTPAVGYVLEVKRQRGEWTFRQDTTDTTAAVTLQPGTWQVRVAARDSADHQGPFSEASDPVTITAPEDPDLPDIHDPIHREERR